MHFKKMNCVLVSEIYLNKVVTRDEREIGRDRNRDKKEKKRQTLSFCNIK